MLKQTNNFFRIQILSLLIVIAGIFLMASFLENAKAQAKNSAMVSIKSLAVANVNSGATSKTAVSELPAIIGGGVGLPGRILSNIKIVNGRRVCAKANDHPQKSTKNPKGHIDSECCLDPDETPNSLCYYPQAKYAKFIQRYLNSIGK